MFSITTIASSTTKPVEIVRAISDRLSRLYPNRYMNPKVPSRESGTATLGINVAHRFFRKMKTTMITRAIETISVNSTSEMEARMVVVRSITTVTLIAGEMDASSTGSIFLIRSTVSIMLDAGCLKRIISTAALPSDIPALRRSSTESSTVATSPTRTDAPS